MVRFLYIRSYKRGSAGARLLANTLRPHYRRVFLVGPDAVTPKMMRRIRERTGQVLGWGAERGPITMGNDETTYNLCRDKAEFWKVMYGGFVPDWTTDYAVALEKQRSGEWPTIVERSTTTGTGAYGLRIVRRGEQLREGMAAYCRFVRSSREYRVHLFQGKVIFSQVKKRRNDAPENRELGVRNLANGWVYSSNVGELPIKVRELAETVAAKMGARVTGGVDIIYNAQANTAWALEVNSAPGLCEVTAAAYAAAIRNHTGMIPN